MQKQDLKKAYHDARSAHMLATMGKALQQREDRKKVCLTAFVTF